MHHSATDSDSCPGDEFNWTVAELDYGNLPPGMLVIREVVWSRVVGVVVGLLVGVPVSWGAWIIAVRYHDVPTGLFFAGFAALPLGGSIWLVGQLLNRHCYYVAMDGQRYYRRWGPRQMHSFPLQELGSFVERRGTLVVEHVPTRRRLVVIKNAYSPERLPTLASRCNAWRTVPHELREPLMGHLNVVETRDARIAANRQIVSALKLVCLYPLLIVVAVRFHVFGPTAIAFWAFLTLASAGYLIRGIVKRLTVPHLKPVAMSEQSVEDGRR